MCMATQQYWNPLYSSGLLISKPVVKMQTTRDAEDTLRLALNVCVISNLIANCRLEMLLIPLEFVSWFTKMYLDEGDVINLYQRTFLTNRRNVASSFAVNGLRMVRLRPAIHFSYFTDISRMFSQNTPGNKKHSLNTFRTCEFHVLLMPQKSKLQNPLTFRTNADPGTKCCEMRKAKKGAQNVKKVTQNTPLYTLCQKVSNRSC